jgi:hypothetical protein
MNVYCVYAYPEVEGAMYPCVERIFDNEESAVACMEEINKKSGSYQRATCVDRMKVEN